MYCGWSLIVKIGRYWVRDSVQAANTERGFKGSFDRYKASTHTLSLTVTELGQQTIIAEVCAVDSVLEH